MELLIHIMTAPSGMAAAGLLAVVGLIILSKRRRLSAIRDAYRQKGFKPLSRRDFSSLLQARQYQLLGNRMLAVFGHKRSFVGTVDERTVVQFLRTKYAVQEKYHRFTTVTQVTPSIDLPAFTLKTALAFDFYLFSKPQNRLSVDANREFSEKFELCGADCTQVLALFNESLCQDAMADEGINIECNGKDVIVFDSGRQICNAEDIDRFVQRATDWVRNLEVAQVSVINLIQNATPASINDSVANTVR